jgi:hypothetical protein
MANTYLTLKQKHQAEVDAFPMAFAFSDKQFEEAMAKLELKAKDTDKVLSIGGGGIIRKTDREAFHYMFAKNEIAKKEAIDGDLTGDGFIFDMFSYELANHEYGYTWDVEPTLEALGLTMDEVKADKKLLHGLTKARKSVRESE